MILGDDTLINKCRKATPNDKWCHVNFDAIDRLPDEYEAIITELKFDIKHDFYDIGNNTFMPKPEFCYDIAKACGISGGDDSINEPLVEMVDINRVRADLTSGPNIQKMVVGRIVKKYSTVIQEDGTVRKSSVCSSAYNAFERCCELWSKEENDTAGYTCEIKNGLYNAFDKDQYGEHYYKGKYAYPIKYRTRWQRQAQLDAEIKGSGAKAETKAHLKTIRELAGLMTGYKKEDLSAGILVFSKIRRSSMVLKMETAARLQALSEGHKSSTELLFGTEPIKIAPPPEKKQTTQANLIAILEEYLRISVVHESDVETAQNIIIWAKKIPEESDAVDQKYWPNVRESLTLIESKIPEELRIHHGIK